uniref:Tripartite motif-containing 33-like n=1 Tax=Nothobranchius kadleci TaxID=1051664 RepID=A0A1A8BE64_NOTKA
MEREESGTTTVNDKEMTSLVHMETIEERGDLLNQQCSNCDGNLARHWCLDCYEALCGDCVTAHRRVTLTRSHRLLNQPCNDDRFRPPIKFCKLHPPEPLRLFCFTCNHLTCRDCQLLAHKNHRFSFANEAVDGLRKKLDACMQPIRAQMEVSRKSLQDMEMRLKVLARSELHLTNSLQEVFRSLSELLKARLERLTREIQTIYDLEREMIKGRMLKVKELQEGHRSVREAADKAQNSRDLLVVLRCVEQVTSQVKDLKDQDLSPPSNMVYLKVTTDRQTVESMIRFGKLLLSWVPFCVSKEFKESVEPHPASSTSSPTNRTRLLPSFEVVLGDDDNIIRLKEPHVSDVSDEDSDVTEDFTKSGSSDSPMSVEVLSCSACLSPSASKICSMCGRGYHVDCHVPPVGPDIWSEWICSLCQDLSDPSDPYSSDRPKSLQGTGLSPLDQRRCETLLLHLKVEGYRRFSELDLWSDVVLISERLTHHRPPPYQTAAQLVSDLWTLFLDSSQSEELEKLQQSFLKKLKETLGAELPASLLVAPTSDKASGEGPSCSVSGTEMPREQGDFKDVRKRLRDFLGLKFSSASKRTKKH